MEIQFIHFNRHTLHDEVQAENEPTPILLAKDDSSHPRQGSPQNPCLVADTKTQIRMGFDAKWVTAQTKHLDFMRGERNGLSASANDRLHARQFQHANSLA